MRPVLPRLNRRDPWESFAVFSLLLCKEAKRWTEKINDGYVDVLVIHFNNMHSVTLEAKHTEEISTSAMSSS